MQPSEAGRIAEEAIELYQQNLDRLGLDEEEAAFMAVNDVMCAERWRNNQGVTECSKQSR